MLRILLVEDNRFVSWAMTQALSSQGCVVHQVFTARDAMDVFGRDPFDVIVLDYQLPDRDGLDLARSIREARPGTRIFLVTALARSDLRIEEGLIDGYFNKPVDLKDLYASLARLAETGAEPAEDGKLGQKGSTLM